MESELDTTELMLYNLITLELMLDKTKLNLCFPKLGHR